MAKTLRLRHRRDAPPLHRTPRPRAGVNRARGPLNLARNPRKWSGQADKYPPKKGHHGRREPDERGGGGPRRTPAQVATEGSRPRPRPFRGRPWVRASPDDTGPDPRAMVHLLLGKCPRPSATCPPLTVGNACGKMRSCNAHAQAGGSGWHSQRSWGGTIGRRPRVGKRGGNHANHPDPPEDTQETETEAGKDGTPISCHAPDPRPRGHPFRWPPWHQPIPP